MIHCWVYVVSDCGFCASAALDSTQSELIKASLVMILVEECSILALLPFLQRTVVGHFAHRQVVAGRRYGPLNNLS